MGGRNIKKHGSLKIGKYTKKIVNKFPKLKIKIVDLKMKFLMQI